MLAEDNPYRAFECGLGLAEGATAPGPLWDELTARYASADPKLRNATVLAGFIHQAHQRAPAFVRAALDAAIQDPALAPNLPYLQGRVAIDEEGIARLRQAIALGKLEAGSFYSIANGVIGDALPQALGSLLS